MTKGTISAQRTPNTGARKAQEEAPNLINVMTVEEMRKLPDVNIAETVRRIPGISMETDTGEGRFINIRGLDADLNSTTFGGLRLPPSNNASPFDGGRAVALDAIPTALVGAITVTRSNLPEHDAEALGGTIEITPKTAPRNSQPFLEARIGSGYEPLRKTGIADLSIAPGGRWRTRNAGGQPYSYVGIPALPLTSASSGGNVNSYDGAYNNGPQMTSRLLQNLLASYQRRSAIRSGAVYLAVTALKISCVAVCT